MQTKLTLRIDSKLIKQAKKQAKKSGKSLSKIVADYFAAISADNTQNEEQAFENQLPPITRSLIGSLRSSKVDESDYYKYLDEKYR